MINLTQVINKIFLLTINDCSFSFLYFSDNINICYLFLLHAVLTPTSKVIKGRHIKYTIRDSQRAFTLTVSQAADIDKVLTEKREECFTNKITLQPLIVAVGEEFHYKRYYVVLDDVKYEFQSYLEAINFCFKLIYVLNLQYPPQCQSVWIFIQKFFFNVHESDQKNPVVDTLIKDLEIRQLKQPDL